MNVRSYMTSIGSFIIYDVKIIVCSFFQAAYQSNSYYKFLKRQSNSNRRKREFVLGALFKKFIGNCHIIDCSANPGERVELNVKVEGTENVSTVTIANPSHQTELTQSAVALGTQLPKRGTVRKDVGDVVDMWGLGYKNKGIQTKYALTKKVKEEMRRVSLNGMKYMGEVFAEAIDSIQTAEKNFLLLQVTKWEEKTVPVPA
jgi:hypothetical protein